VAGLLVEPADAASFETRLRQLLADRPRLTSMRRAATNSC